MKKIIPGVLMLLVAAMPAFAQKSGKSVQLKKTSELKMPKTVDDDAPGTRGASVAWHPVQKKYYAVFAGNMSYPLAVFAANGKRLSGDDLSAMIDTRGIWYNPNTKLITGNAYSEGGWFTYKLNTGGLVTDYTSVIEGQNQPDPQCVGAYNTAAKRVLFLKGGQVYSYGSNGYVLDSLPIHWGRSKADGPADDEDIYSSPEDYNYTSLVYTGIKGQELGFLNTTNKEIELYDIKTGYRTKILSLPLNTVAEASFNFAYANGTYWLFNMEDRKWIGYK